MREYSTARDGPLWWASYAAAAWAFVFAAMSFYWAAGGTLGLSTVGVEIERLSRERDEQMIALTWVTGLLKVVAGLVALYAAQMQYEPLPHRLVRLTIWVIAGLLLMYGGLNLIQHALMELGAIEIPDGLGASATRWHLFFWDPFWLLGGMLFLATGWVYARRTAADIPERR